MTTTTTPMTEDEARALIVADHLRRLDRVLAAIDGQTVTSRMLDNAAGYANTLIFWQGLPNPLPRVDSTDIDRMREVADLTRQKIAAAASRPAPSVRLLDRVRAGEQDHQRAIDSFRATLISKAESLRGAEQLSSICNDMARHEGARGVYARASQVLDNGGTVESIVEMLFDIATMGADDGWSGRGNDVKRATADGRLEAVRAIRVAIETIQSR